MNLPKKTSVGIIVATYNKPSYLRASLRQLLTQDHFLDQIIVADDGSGDETRAVVEEFSKLHTNLLHVWHKDTGFQKCQILNKAISKCSTQYIIFSDDDCLCPPWFVSAHLEAARRGAFTVGSSVNLGLEISRKILDGETRFRDFLNLGSTRKMNFAETESRGGFGKLFFRTALTGKPIGKVFDRAYIGRGVFRGGNSGAWRDDLVKVNGFNNLMAYGHEDREIGERLRNLGLACRQVRYYGANFHLHHERSYVDLGKKREQRNLCKKTKKDGTTFVSHGITDFRATHSL